MAMMAITTSNSISVNPDPAGEALLLSSRGEIRMAKRDYAGAIEDFARSRRKHRLILLSVPTFAERVIGTLRIFENGIRSRRRKLAIGVPHSDTGRRSKSGR